MAKKLYGTDPDQVPTNADLGTMAYQDSAHVVIDGGSARIDAARPASDNTSRAELELYASGNAPTYIVNNSDRAAAGQHIAEFRGQWDGTAVARMVVAAGTDTTNKDDGVLSFWTASAGTMAKAAEFTSAGNLAFPNGQGIDFSATGDGSGTMTSELLDDYEEGTWTPILKGSTGNPTVTYTTQKGRYVKVGQMVHVSIDMRWSAQSGGSGNTFIGGFPYTNGDSYWGATIFESSSSWNWGSGRSVLGFEIQQNNTQGSVLVSGTNLGSSSLNISNLGTGSGYTIFSFSYRTT